MIALLLATSLTNPVISIGVQAINEISVQTMASSITIPLFPDSVSAQSAYSITTNGDYLKIIGSLDLTLPSNLQISATLQAPPGAQSLGQVNLSAQSATLVSGISRVVASNLAITYTFSSKAPVPAGNYSQIIRLTLTN